MKLKMHPFSYNGGSLGNDEFAYTLRKGSGFDASGVCEIVLPCSGGKFNKCIIRLTLGEQDEKNSIFHWDGNMEEPTITPSIGCDSRCGWHGHLIKGVLTL